MIIHYYEQQIHQNKPSLAIYAILPLFTVLQGKNSRKENTDMFQTRLDSFGWLKVVFGCQKNKGKVY